MSHYKAGEMKFSAPGVAVPFGEGLPTINFATAEDARIMLGMLEASEKVINAKDAAIERMKVALTYISKADCGCIKDHYECESCTADAVLCDIARLALQETKT